jgi:hypothetical protein
MAASLGAPWKVGTGLILDADYADKSGSAQISEKGSNTFVTPICADPRFICVICVA